MRRLEQRRDVWGVKGIQALKALDYTSEVTLCLFIFNCEPVLHS